MCNRTVPFLIPAIGFFICSGVILYDPAYFFMDPLTGAVLSILLMYGAAYRARQWKVSWDKERALVKLESLHINRIPVKNGNLYVGRGFEWGSDKTQALFNLDRQGRLMTRDEGKRMTGTGAKGSDLGGMPTLHGIGYLEEEDVFVPLSELQGHMFICGATQSGKTRFFELLADQAIRRGDCLIVIDPKWDRGPKWDSRLLDRMYDGATKAGKADRFGFFSLSWPKRSMVYNPLQNFVLSAEIPDRIARLLPSGGESEPFRAFSWGVLNKVTKAMLLMGERPTLDRLRRYCLIKGATEELAGQLPDGREKEDLQEVIAHNRDHYGKMISSLDPLLEKLTSPGVGRLLSPREEEWQKGLVLDWQSAVEETMIIYLNTGSLSLGETGYAIAKMTLQDFIAFIGRRYVHDKEQPTKITVLIDEFHNIPWDGAIDLLNKAGGAGVRVAIAGQTVADIAANLGRERAQQILGNCNIKIWLRAADEEIAKRFCEMGGKTVLNTLRSDVHYSYNTRKDTPLFDSRWGRSTNEVLEHRVRPEWIEGLPKGQAFAYMQGKLYKLRIPMLPEPEHTFPIPQTTA